MIYRSSRIANNYRIAWIPIAENYDALLLCPPFAGENGFHTDQQFNLGNFFKVDSRNQILVANRESNWAYLLIDPIFDYVICKMGNHAKGYSIYGQLAGSQFVYGFLPFKSDANMPGAILANAGWYTFPHNGCIPLWHRRNSVEQALTDIFSSA